MLVFILKNSNQVIMKKRDLIRMYREWRKANGNKKPNRVIVRMHWEDVPGNSLVDTIGIVPLDKIGDTSEIPGDWFILFYVSSLKGLWELTKPNNGSDFVVEKVLEFYRNPSK